MQFPPPPSLQPSSVHIFLSAVFKASVPHQFYSQMGFPAPS
jgi:hypothetical protein